MHSWAKEGEELRLLQFEKERDKREKREKKETDPVALCCYGMLRGDNGKMMVRFVEGRPVSQVSIDYLEWVCECLAKEGKRVLLMIWDNASWHVSKAVRAWLRSHNRSARRAQQKGEAAVRIMPFYLPVKSPWLNPIEPKWLHGKKAIVEPKRRLSADEVRTRVYGYFRCKPLEPLIQKHLP